MNSGMNTLAGGFPHSEISGSMLVCQLPGAFRRLPRLSSPVVAKASTACAWSLDPLTPNPGAVCGPHFFPSLRARGAAGSGRPPPRGGIFRSRPLYIAPSTLLKNCRTPAPPSGQLPPRSARVFGSIRDVSLPRAAHGRARRSGFRSVRPPSAGFGLWWSQAGSNRRPPACKAGALPAELWPRRWWVWVDSNHRPHPYQGCALTA